MLAAAPFFSDINKAFPALGLMSITDNINIRLKKMHPPS